MATKERDYLAEQLKDLKEFRAALPGRFSEAQQQVEKHIEQLMEKAGILNEVRRAKDELEKVRAQLQRQADVYTGKIEVLEYVFDTYHRDPVDPGTILHGIDISKLDWQTRLMVRSGNLQTIMALGGRLDAPKEVSTDTPKSSTEVGEQVAVIEGVDQVYDAASQVGEYSLSDLQDLVQS